MEKTEIQDGTSTDMIVILKASPRAGSNSSRLAEELAASARQAGGSVKEFGLHGMDLRACDGCDSCQHPQGSGCVIDDDMQLIYPFLKLASALVLATPVYWFTFSAQLKLAIDRFYALESPGGHGLKGKDMVLVLTYGDDDPYTSGAVNAIRSFQDMCRYTGSPVAGILYGTASAQGEMESQTELLAQARALGAKLAGA